MLNKFLYLLGAKANREMEKNEITKEKLEEMVERGTVLIDVRSPQEYAEGHLDGAILIPEYDLKRRINELPQDKETEIVLYCSTGKRSRSAKKKIEKMGYTKVYNLYNGLQNY